MSKYEKLEAEYNLLETPEQQWAWVLAHKDEVKLFRYYGGDTLGFVIKCSPVNNSAGFKGKNYLKSLLSVLGIEAEEV